MKAHFYLSFFVRSSWYSKKKKTEKGLNLGRHLLKYLHHENGYDSRYKTKKARCKGLLSISKVFFSFLFLVQTIPKLLYVLSKIKGNISIAIWLARLKILTCKAKPLKPIKSLIL